MRDPRGPRKGLAICEEYALVSHFEGEEDIQVETKDLPIAQDSLAPNKFPTAENSDLDDFALEVVRERVAVLPLSVLKIPVGCAKLFEGTKTHYDKWDVAVFVVFRFKPFWAVGDCEERQKAIVSTCRGGGLTLEEVGHFVRPPDYVSDEERWLSSRLCFISKLWEICFVVVPPIIV